jgi:K+ transporter
MWTWYTTSTELNEESKRQSLLMNELLKMIKRGQLTLSKAVADDPETRRMSILRTRRRTAAAFAVESLGRRSTAASIDENPHQRIVTLARTTGTGVYIDMQQPRRGLGAIKGSSKKLADVPPVLTSFIYRIPVLPETIVILSIQFLPIPFIAEEDRLRVRTIDERLGVYRIMLNRGYQETDNEILGILERARGMGIPCLDSSNCVFFVGKTSVQLQAEGNNRAGEEDRSMWQKGTHGLWGAIRRIRISWYDIINKNIDGHKQTFQLPAESTIEVGCTVSLKS